MDKQLSAIVVSITPFDDKGNLDEAAYRAHLRRMLEPGLAVYVAGSGSGEAYSLTMEERDRVMAIAVEELKGKMEVRAMGCEPRLVEEMVEFLHRAELAKVDAAQIFSLEIGHGAKPSNAELDHYYSTVIGSTSLPVYLSSHRAAGYFLPLDLIERLVDRFPNVAGVAYSGPDIPYIAELISRVGDRVKIHSAGPGNALTMLGLGANGFMGGEGNFMPVMFSRVITAWQNKDMEALRTSFSTLMGLTGISNRYGGSSMRAMKPLMNAFGLPGGTLRSPRVAVGGKELDEVIAAVLKLKIPGAPALLKKS